MITVSGLNPFIEFGAWSSIAEKSFSVGLLSKNNFFLADFPSCLYDSQLFTGRKRRKSLPNFRCDCQGIGSFYNYWIWDVSPIHTW